MVCFLLSKSLPVLIIFLLCQSRSWKIYFYSYWTLNLRIVQPFRVAKNTFLSAPFPCLQNPVIIHLSLVSTDTWFINGVKILSHSYGKQNWWDSSGHVYVGCKDHGYVSIIYNFSSVKVSKICANSQISSFVHIIHYVHVK